MNVRMNFEKLIEVVMNNFSSSTCMQSLAMWAVMKFYHMLRSGISWKINETIIEL